MQVMLREPGSEVFVAADVREATRELLCIAKSSWLREFENRWNSGQFDEDVLWLKLSMLDGTAGQADPWGFVVLHRDEVQGVLLLDETPADSRSDPAHKVLYLRYLAAAPWNRRGCPGARRFRHVGSALLAAAAEVSLATEYTGRIGLHSLRGAEGFYLHYGLHDFGPDPAHRGLHYFEGETIVRPARSDVPAGQPS